MLLTFVLGQDSEPIARNEEEERSLHLPKHLACDACEAVTVQVDRALQAAHKNTGIQKKLPLADLIEVLEAACVTPSFQGYAVTEVEGRRRIKGPGLDPTKGKDIGKIYGRIGKLPDMLRFLCLEMVGEWDDREMELYMEWREKEGKIGDMLCRNADYSKGSGLARCLGEEESNKDTKQEL